MEENKKKSILGLIITNAILLVLVLLYIFDMIHASGFSLKLGATEGSNHTFDEWLADGMPGEIHVLLTNSSGEPVVGHSIYALVEAGDGQFASNRGVTDEEGRVVFVFTVPIKRASSFDIEAQRAEIKIYDEDNSIFFLVPKTRRLTVNFKPIPDETETTN